MGDTKLGGTDTFRFCYQIEGIGIPVAIGLIDISLNIITGISSEKTQVQAQKF